MQTLTDPAAQASLWKRARGMCARAVAEIGEPAALAARSGLAQRTKHDIAGWLARLESIVRKLLLALAAALLQDSGRVTAHNLHTRVAPVHATPVCAAQPTAAHSSRAPDLSQPETWSVRFALAPPRDPYAVPESRAPRIRALWGATPAPAPEPPPQTARRVTESGQRFAFRLEALKRVLADPVRYAERLARVMCRLVRRYPGAADRYAIAPARPCVADEGDPRLIIDAISAAMFGAPVMAADTS